MLPDEIVTMLRTQHGLLADHQMRSERLDSAVRRRIRRHPDFERLTARVLRHRGSPPTARQGAMAAVLDNGSGAMLWDVSAATLWGFGRHRLLPAHVAIERRHRSRQTALGERHFIGEMERGGRTTLDGIPVSRPELTLLWIAGALTHRFGHEIALERFSMLLDDAWRRRLVDGRYLHDLVARSGGKGRSGVVVARAAVEHRPPDYRPAGSRLEERFEELLPADVRGQLVRQVTVGVDPVVRTVDYRCRRWPLVAEINSEMYHASISDRLADEERYRDFVRTGFSVVVWWEHDIWHDSATVARAMTQLVRRPDAAPTVHRPTPGPWPEAQDRFLSRDQTAERPSA